MSTNHHLWLRADLAEAWRERDPFVAAKMQQGTVYRDKEGRRTLRCEIDGRGYFLKLHQGVGWSEVFKNLLQGRLPVLGASNEYNAIKALEQLHIDTLSVAGYAQRGLNPATQLSFLVTDELTHIESLEDFCARWPQQPPNPVLKRKLIERVAAIARAMHAAGINHRDFYLCHFLLDVQTPASAENIETKKLHLMDLHRAQIRAQVPRRWLIKDLGGLYYSALDIGLNRRDIFRFIRAYSQKSLRTLFTDDRQFWRDVSQRARQIYVRDNRREPTGPAWINP
jgi:heptose I phosphotransferase